MSDGPYKSSNMSPAWKRVAKVAGNRNHTLAEVAEAFRPALLEDLRAVGSDFMSGVRSALGDTDRGLLFPEVAQAEVERLRGSADTPVKELLLDVARDLVRDGRVGLKAFEGALTATLDEWALRRCRQTEEHYKRVAPRAAASLRARLNGAFGAIGTDQMAAGIVGGATSRSIAPKADRSGLDEGVPL